MKRPLAARRLAVRTSALLALACSAALPAAPALEAPKSVLILAGVLIDGTGAPPSRDVAILVEGERIRAVGPRGKITSPAGTPAIDLGKATVLPGLIDAHTHILLQGDPTVASYEDQILRESLPMRTIRGTVAAGLSLRNGFTTIRDLETEGALYADVAIKEAIRKGYIEGPRMAVATRALSTTGSYPLLGFPYEVQVPTGVQVCDGADECRKAVREQIKYGADWIKFYADRNYYLAADGHLDALPNFTQEEANAIVEQAHAWKKKVAAHAMTRAGVGIAIAAGVDSIEHGDSIEEPHMRQMIAKGIAYCPTLTALDYVAAPRAAEGRGIWAEMPKIVRDTFRRAVSSGVKIVFGTDAGGFPWTEVKQAREFSLMVEYGMSPAEAVRSAASAAADLLDMSADVGRVAPGRYADLIAVLGDPLENISILEDVRFVMKGGKIVRNDLAGSR